MNVLFLTIGLPYPMNSGADIRTFNLIRCISEKHSVVLLSLFGSGHDNKAALSHLRKYCKEIKVLFTEEQVSKKTLLLKSLLSIFTGKPLTIFKYYFPLAKIEIFKAISSKDINFIHCDHLHMAQYVEDVENIPKLLDEHNIEFFLIRRYVKEQKNLIKKALAFFLQCLKLKRYEADVAKKFDHCVVVSGVDKRNLESIAPGVNATVISNGVDTDFYRPQNETLRPNSLIFTGAMDWFPNEDAILYFYDKIWPRLKSEVNGIRLYVVGRNPSDKVLNLSKKDKNIVVTGYVEDVRPYTARSTVYIVPLRIGGGSRLKILEAMAMGKAIVSTSVGAEGLEVDAGENILIADPPEEFAGRIISLLKDKSLRSRLGEAAREMVINKYSWEIIGARLNDVYIKTVNQSGKNWDEG